MRRVLTRVSLMELRPEAEPGPTLEDLASLPRAFFEPSAEQVAPELLGHWLVRRTSRGLSGGVIVETEAYLANDPASHGFRRETRRNRSMYGPPGHAYVYFIYGNHWCFNAVCRPAGVAEAVLVRAVEAGFGLDWMRDQRRVAKPQELSNGPAKLCAALGIEGSLDAVDLCEARSAVVLARNPGRTRALRRLGPVVVTTRIELTQAADWPLRFLLAGSASLSRPAGHGRPAPSRRTQAQPAREE